MKRSENDERRPQEIDLEETVETENEKSEPGAVSQHSLEAAGYGEPTEAARDAGYEEELDEGDAPHDTPIGMARIQLEEATEAPVHPGPTRDKRRDAIPPAEEAAMHVRPDSAR